MIMRMPVPWRNDATEIAEVLINRFSFPKENVVVLLNGDATKIGILRNFMRFTNANYVGKDDRIFFFFAGHGHTVRGRRDTGFLIPVDGDTNDLSSLIRWDELTRNADLIPAKHMFFVMDACYGGLAVHRRVAPRVACAFCRTFFAGTLAKSLRRANLINLSATAGERERGIRSSRPMYWMRWIMLRPSQMA